MVHPEKQKVIHELWDTLAQLPASKHDKSLELLLSTIGRLIQSDHGFWFSMHRLSDVAKDDLMMGWRMGHMFNTNPLPEEKELHRKTVKDVDNGRPGDCLLTNIRSAGKFRASRIRDRVPASYFESDFYKENMVNRGFHDGLSVVTPLNEDSEIYVGFLRKHSQPKFTEEDLAVASYSLRSLTWFHRRTLLSHGLVLAENPLTTTERKVMRRLLTDWSEKQIADDLEQKLDTTHKHVGNIYRKFNVNSRAGLMSVWLGHEPVQSEESA
jgi:DNA-binding CsgD family transcriptional regulator